MIYMKSKITTILTFIICAYTIICAGAAESSAYEIGSCQNLTIENGNYLLNQSVSSEGTCFTISADNIVLDGQGYTINYSNSTTGYGIDNSAGYDNITIKNLNIVQGKAIIDYTYAIYGHNMSDSTIKDNTIATSQDEAYGIYLRSSSMNIITNNTIATSGLAGWGIFLHLFSDSNILYENKIASSGPLGFGIYLMYSNLNNINKNTITTSGESAEAIKVTIGNENDISGNTISTSNTEGYGIRIYYANESNVSNNIITTSGYAASGIFIFMADSNYFSDNTVTTSNYLAYGLYIYSSNSNTIIGGSIISKADSDYYLKNASNTNTFTDTNFTASREIHLNDNSSWFNYNNKTDGDIWLKTSVSQQAHLARTLSTWSKRELTWNDTGSDSLTASYNITGLSPNTYYNIYNTSEGTQTNPYTLKTDSDGNLPGFTIALKGNTEIKVIDKPPAITIDYPDDKTIIPSDTTYFNITTDENATCRYSYSSNIVSRPYYTYYYSCCELKGCVGVPPSGPVSGWGGTLYKLMDITGTTKHSQIVQIHWTFLRYENTLIANCTDNAGNSNTASVPVISREKPLTIETLMPDNNKFSLERIITVYLRLTTNHTIDNIILNIERPDNTTDTYTEDDFSEKVGAKQFMKLINMTYSNLTLTGNYTMNLYVNDTEGNIDTATRTFSVHPSVDHIINNTKNSDQVNVYYQNPKNTNIYNALAHLLIRTGSYSNITLPGTELDLYFYYGTYYEFNIIIPALNISKFQKLTIEGKKINETNISLHERYIAKDAYIFNIENSSSMNKSFKVEFDYSYSNISNPTKIVIFKAPYNSTTNKTDYDSAIYYSAGNPDYPLYYNPTTEKAWIYVNSFSTFALLEDKATAEICGDNIDNDYDGAIDEGCSTGGGGSSSSSYSSGPPPVIHECENNTGCSTDQICENFKCINITCSYCEYIENHECIKYECCEDKDCEDNYSCKNHQCIKQEEKEAIIIEDNTDAELRTIEETNEPETKYTPPAESESTNILGYAIKNLPSKTTLATIMFWLAIIVLVFLKKDKIRNIILGK